MSIEKLRERIRTIDRMMTPSGLMQVPVREIRDALQEYDEAFDFDDLSEVDRGLRADLKNVTEDRNALQFKLDRIEALCGTRLAGAAAEAVSEALNG